MSEEEYGEFESALCRSHGHCMEMATAMSMAVATEALGIALPDNASVPAVDVRRSVLAERSGRRAVDLARDRVRPRDVMTKEAFENAIRVNMAVGGSTNAVVHLLAIAGRLGVDLDLGDFAAAEDIPVLANLRPSGEHLLEAFFHAGGVPALMAELGDLLHTDLATVTGRTVAENIAGRRSLDRDVIRALDDPVSPRSGIAVVRGSLAPDGAVIKRSAADDRFLRHRGTVLAFEDVRDLARRLDDPDLPVTPDTVIVLKGAGPLGGPGMPEWGHIPVPGRLRHAGVEDMLRVSDGRISGGSHGAMVVHVAPEAAALGPIAAAETGDVVSIDVDRGLLELEVPAREIAQRLAARPAPQRHYRRGYGAMYLDHVLQADAGCDFDFLRRLPDDEADGHDVPLGLLEGWVLGD
jgi:dihydroxy-acid dehydratase